MKEKIYDIAIIGGGINGCGIARDAAGRGLDVYLCDQQDLGAATSCSSTKLIHGGLRYLETYEFSLVKKALKEREALLNIAPHIIWPLSFVLPHQKHLRPKWMLRAGLFLYDHLAPLGKLHKSQSVKFEKDETGRALKEEFKTGFSYSDCWVDDHRLVILNALDAQKRGAVIEPNNKCIHAEVVRGVWHINTEKGEIKSRILVNAAGPWAQKFLDESIPMVEGRRLRLVKGSHIVVPKLFNHKKSYIFQQEDGRIVFAIPYENDFTLIGTTDEAFHGDLSKVEAEENSKKYLCGAVNKYFKKQISSEDVVWSYAGVRPLLEDRSADSASKASRDYRVSVRAEAGGPLVNIWGGKITTYRVLAEDVMGSLSALAKSGDPWTEKVPLIGAEVEEYNIESYAQELKEKYSFLSGDICHRYARSYGTLCEKFLLEKTSKKDLGTLFAAGLYQAEIDYLIDQEWAHSVDAILYRRTKLGLHMSSSERAKVQSYVEKVLKIEISDSID